MAVWIFKGFLSESGRDLFQEWYEQLPERAQAKFDTILEYLRDTPHTQWSTTVVLPLSEAEGIFEIRFKIRNVLYRPLGCFGPSRGEFTLLVPAREHGNRFEPNNAITLAEARRTLVLKDKGRARECDF
jgi:hypothetical protein